MEYKIEHGFFCPFQVHCRRKVNSYFGIYSVDNPWTYVKGFDTIEEAQKFIDSMKNKKVGEIQ